MVRKDKINGIFSRQDKRWKKLLELAKPKEEGDSYIMDYKSQGIVTQTLQNPKNITAKGYLREAFNLYSKGEALYKEGDYLKAYDYVLVAYLLSRMAEHVDYYSAIRKLKKSKSIKVNKENLVDLLKNQNKKLIHISEEIGKLKSTLSKKIIEKGLQNQMQKINKKYNMHFDYPTDFKVPKPSPKRKYKKKILPFKKKETPQDKILKLEEELKDKKFDIESLDKTQTDDKKIKDIVKTEIAKSKKDVKSLEKEIDKLKEAV